jgi:hypothetical protein
MEDQLGALGLVVNGIGVSVERRRAAMTAQVGRTPEVR